MARYTYLSDYKSNRLLTMLRCTLKPILMVVLAVLIMPGLAIAAKDPEVFEKMEGSLGEIAVGQFREVVDPVYYNPILRANIADVTKDRYQNVVALFVNEETAPLALDFTCRISLRLTYEDLMGNMSQPFDFDLQVSYNKQQGVQYNARQYYYFSNARKAKVEITGIDLMGGPSTIINALRIENRLAAYRDYIFNCHSSVTINPSGKITKPDEVTVAWVFSPTGGATHYDVEWAWIDDDAANKYLNIIGGLAQPDARLIFRRNATRVTLTNDKSNYTIPLLYDGVGRLYYRIRPVQYRENGDIVEGDWNVQTTVTANDYETFNGHEENQLNWQASTSFAEEGKRKSVVQYFDGTLRTRQTVTKDNSTPDNNTVVAETYYDYQGRPAINILPAPTLNKVLEYARNFNRFTTNPTYPKEAYDELLPNQGVCQSGTPTLDNAFGAAKYYSPNNTLIAATPDNMNNYIPDALGYPYTETRYTPDGTGRIAEQSGVGPQHQLGNGGHATIYYYGSPDQKELDALFGLEAGYASHYFKNMVKDANGQYSVSYTDMHGRTVATALAGNPPANVAALPSYTAAKQTITKDLLTPENNQVQDRSVVSSSTLIVTDAGLHKFLYKLTPQSAEIMACNPMGETVCYDCYYDVEIKIVDACGTVIEQRTEKNFTFGNYDVNCNVPSPSFNIAFDKYLTEGEYNVIKTLTVSKQAQDWYRDNVFANKNICKTLQQLRDDLYNVLLSQSDCNNLTCASCTTAVGSLADFKTRFLQQVGIVNPTAELIQEIEQSWREALANCDVVCKKKETQLDIIRTQMLEDMTPPMGQYARTNMDLNHNGTTTDVIGTAPNQIEENGLARPYNILGNNIYPAPLPFANFVAPYYKTPLDNNGQASIYKTADGQKDPAAYETNGNAVLGNIDDFTSAFKNEWANSLLYYHPEFAKLKYAEANLKPSYDFDAQLDGITKWSAALTANYINSNAAAIVNLDPFFAVGAPGYAQRQTMINYITTDWYHGAGLWKLAYAGIACLGEDVASSTCITTAPTFPTHADFAGRCESDRDYMWQLFKSLYIAVKNDMVNNAMAGLVNANIYVNLKNYGYQRRFGSFAEYMSQDQLMNTLQSNINQQTPNANGAGTAAQTAINDIYKDNCESYINYWENELEKCDVIKNHPQKQAILDAITPMLKAICIAGSDAEHPLGSSTVPSNSTQTPSSFEQAISTVLGSYGITPSAICHPYMIDFPRPYDQQPPLSDGVLPDRKDDCLCAKLTTIKANMAALGSYDISPAMLPNNMSIYLKNMYGYIVAPTLLATLIDGCNNLPPNCKTYNPPLTVPAFLLDCKPLTDNCINCAQYNQLKDAFTTYHNGVFDRAPVVNPQTAADIQLNEAFAQYMNQKTGFNKRWQEYVAFAGQCGQIIGDFKCDDLETILDLYKAPNGTSTVLDCQNAFTLFFNTHFGTGYSFLQISTLYEQLCGKKLNVCKKLAGRSDIEQLTLRMYHRYGANYGQTGNWQPTFTNMFNDEFGTDNTEEQVMAIVQSLTNENFIIAGPNSYARLYIIDSAYRANTLNLGWLNNNCEQSFINYFNSQTQQQLSWSAVLELYQTQGIVLKVCATPANCETLTQLDASYNNQGAVACSPQVSPSAPEYCKDCYTFFINKALNSNYTYEQLALMHQRACGSNGSSMEALGICSSGFSCEELTTFHTDFLKDYTDSLAGSNCRGFFTQQFNAHYSTSYTFTQILSLYLLYCGQEPPFCQPVSITTAAQLETTLSNFMGLYPNPAGYFGSGCTTAFANFFNQSFSTNYSYAEINNFYVSLTEQPLQFCTVNNIGALLTFKNNFNNQYTTYPMPASLARDLFTAVYNRDLSPGEYHDWLHIRNIYAAAGIALNIYNADSTAMLTCSKLEGVQIAYGTIYTNSNNSIGQEESFATFFNQYFGTGYTYADILAYATACGLEKYDPLTAAPAPVVILEQEGDPQPGSVLPIAILLCGRNEPYSPPVITPPGPCDYLKDMALQMATEQYRAYLTQQYNLFDNTYLNKCLEARKLESFTVEAPVAEYHYTLYYYNQAGNLVKTVPPAGANPDFTPAYLASVKAARENGTTVPPPAHTLVTQYRYNTLGQVVAQHSPDGGTSHFWYDALGRLVVSQNAKQKLTNLYSFTQYDALGRITEVGEKMQATDMEPSISEDPTLLSGWMSVGGSKKQVTKTVYDEPYTVGNFQTQVLRQRNLRNRVSYTYVQDDESVTAPDRIPWQAATLYSYDIHGNVDVLVQDFRSGMGLIGGNRWKRMEYQYDLISGKVNEVAYQPGHIDGFYHRYSYDAENKLKEVYTSRDKLYWERDAAYEYYRHGPLARTVLGQRQVQGLDYGYTLQGWLKGVNSHSRTLALYDMGQDGRPSLSHGNVARDVFGYSLNYNPGDYKAISSTVAPWAAGNMHNLVNSDLQTVAAPLYNGNIASMLVSVPQLGLTQLYGYKYDQLNRIVSMDAFGGMNNDANSFTAIATADYKERVSYDPNGNILSYWRNGAATANGTAMDKLTYQYPKDAAGKLLNNRLRYVHDDVNSAYTDDIDSQTPLNLVQVQAEKLPEQAGDNYAYDAIGNLLKDTKEGIASISWNVYGKISEIQRNGTAENPVTTIKYTYDASGNRIGKAVWKLGDVLPTNTYYVRDASGNVMGVYESGQSTGYNLTQKEVHLYGSNRLGILNTDVNVQSGNLLVNNTGTITFTRGNKFFELSNHLGNVLATISDKKIPVSGNGTWVDWYMADVVTANDYYPFGAIMPGRKFAQAGKDYRFSINGQEKERELNENITTALYWEYDSRIGRRWNRDPKPVDGVSPYLAFMNNPIVHIDILGDTGIIGVDGREINVDPGSYGTYDGTGQPLKTNPSKIVYPPAGSLSYFIVTGPNIIDGGVKFIPMFGERSGKFLGYFWDKKPSVSYEAFKKEGEQDFLNNAKAESYKAKHGEWSLPYAPGLTDEERRKNFINSGLGVIMPNALIRPLTIATAVQKVASSSVGKAVADFIKLFKPINEFDFTKTLYRGTTGSETGSAIIFLTDDAAVAATYVKNGGQVMQYEMTQFSLKSLVATGEVEMKMGIHGIGVPNTEYMFKGKNLVEAINTIAKPIQ